METTYLKLSALRTLLRICKRDPRAGRYMGIAASKNGDPAAVFRNQAEKDTALKAVFLPSHPESLVFDLTDTVRRALDKGMRLYTAADGRRALLPGPIKGWVRHGSPEHTRMIKPCAA